MKDTDDEPTRWTSIGWQAALITNRLRNQAQLTNLAEEPKEIDGNESSTTDEAEKRTIERLRFVNRRLQDLRRFEDTARGQRKK